MSIYSVNLCSYSSDLKAHESKAMKCKDCEDEKLICPGPYNFEKHRNEVKAFYRTQDPIL